MRKPEYPTIAAEEQKPVKKISTGIAEQLKDK